MYCSHLTETLTWLYYMLREQHQFTETLTYYFSQKLLNKRKVKQWVIYSGVTLLSITLANLIC